MKNHWEVLVPTLVVILVYKTLPILAGAESKGNRFAGGNGPWTRRKCFWMCPWGCWLVFCLEYASMLKPANLREVIRFHNSSRQGWLENPWFVDASSLKKAPFIIVNGTELTQERWYCFSEHHEWRSQQKKLEPSDKGLRFQIEFVSESGVPWFLIPACFNKSKRC